MVFSSMFSFIRGAFSGENRMAEPPAATSERRRHRLTCRRCKSQDVWRVREENTLIALLMKMRGKKAFQCRYCKMRFYFHARRISD